jgi:prophage DNA circulation protein
MQEWQEKIEQEFEQFKNEVRAELRAELIEEMRRIREQHTEEIPAFNVNVASKDVIDRLDKLESALNTHSETWLNTLQEHYTEHTQDISHVHQAITDVQTVQKGHAKFFEEHGRRLAATSTKEDLSKLETTMATKNDITAMESRLIETMKQLIQQKP